MGKNHSPPGDSLDTLIKTAAKDRKRQAKLNNLTQHVNILAEHLASMHNSHDRMIIAITGAPGAGKSTLASELAKRMIQQKHPTIVVPQDGFHLDNQILQDRALTQRKGAPETFDAPGFIRLIKALKQGGEAFAPIFDRTRDIAIAGAVAVPADTAIIIAEGNYLMFDEPPWSDLAPLWDVTARIDVPLPELRARLIHRWLALNHSRAVATRRAEGNDIPNAQRVIDKALPCDFTFDGQPQTAHN